MDCPSTPGAPLLSLTCSQALQTSYPLTANGLPSSGPPDTVLRPASGLSSSMTLLPERLVDETNKATSKPAPSPPAPPRQAGGSALLRAGPTASPATVSAPRASGARGPPSRRPPGEQQCPGWLSAVPCGRRRPGSRHLYAGHHLASDPGNRQAHPGDLASPRFRCHLHPITTLQTVNAPTSKPGPGAFSAT